MESVSVGLDSYVRRGLDDSVLDRVVRQHLETPLAGRLWRNPAVLPPTLAVPREGG